MFHRVNTGMFSDKYYIYVHRSSTINTAVQPHTHTQTKRRTDTGTHTSTHSLSHTQTNKHTQLKRKFLQISRSQVYPWPDVLFIAEELGINTILDCIHALVTPETEKNTNP